VAIIDKGRLMVDGTPQELLRQHSAATLEELFTRLTGVTGVEARAAEFAKHLLP
jgi:ABC-2 type transport system ATP-binding protein